jgi:UDP-glucose 4-epimerase
MKVLVTGGAGYIGSTTCFALTDAGHEVVILDSLVNGKEEYTKGFSFYRGDIADKEVIDIIFKDHPDIECCLHFAALIVIPESVANPYKYYRENVLKSLELFKILDDKGCKKIVFSSSASIYDLVEDFKVDESAPKRPINPYSRSKYMMEMVLEDMAKATDIKGIALRYFNPIGADPKMRTGPYDPAPSHVLGKMVNVALGEDEIFRITGTDYTTRDGSGIRDYVHVWDLARAHVLAAEKYDEIFAQIDDEYIPINLGTGDGVTVFELVEAFEAVWGDEINKENAPARPGDTAGAYANCERAEKLLGWKAELSVKQGIEDALKWTNRYRKQKLGY